MSTESMQDRIEALRQLRANIVAGGGREKTDKQHTQGKLTARERIAELTDPGSFRETGMFAQHRATTLGMEGAVLPADGVVTGRGAVLGRLVHLASQDFTVAGGSAGEVHCDKAAAAMGLTLKTGTLASSSTTPAERGCRKASTRSTATQRSSSPMCC